MTARRSWTGAGPVFVVLALLVALASAGLPSRPAGAAAEPPPAASPALQVGVQFKGMWSDYTDAERERVLDALAASGVGWVRIDVSWAMLQPDGPDRYSAWGVGFVDRVLAMARARGLRPLVTLWLTPSWASGSTDERVLPRDPADYARAARWAADRWATTVGAWEVWNEPNSDDFLRGADPVGYARLLRAAYAGFKAGAPQTPVLFGGTMYVDTDWIGRAYDAGAQGAFDALAVHPYQGIADTAPEAPDLGDQWRLDHVRALRALMVARGDADKPVWFTEMGWSSHPTAPGAPNWQRGVSEQVQADYLRRALVHVQRSYPYVTHLFWYTEREQVTGDPQHDGYGLLRRDLSPKPAYLALQQHLRGPVPGSTPTPTAASGGTAAPTPTGSTAPRAEAGPTVSPVQSTTPKVAVRRTGAVRLKRLAAGSTSSARSGVPLRVRR